MIRPPAASVISCIRPSTCAGTPATIRSGGCTEALGPGLADQVVVATDPSGRHDDRLGGDLEVLDRDPGAGSSSVDGAGLEDRTADAGHDAVRRHETVDAVPEAELDQALLDGGPDAAHEGLEEARAGAPGDVEARDRVAVAVGTAVSSFGPAHDGEQPVPLGVQPGPLLAGREVDVRLRPRPRPVVLRPVELGAAEPVLERQVPGVLDAHPALLGAVHEEETAEGPERLATEVLLGLLVDQDHAPTGVGQLGGGDETGETGPHDDDVSVHAEQSRALRPPGHPRGAGAASRGASRPAPPGPARAAATAPPRPR